MVAQGKCRKALSDGLDLMFLHFSETFDTTCHGIYCFTESTNIRPHARYVPCIISGARSVFVTPKEIAS